MTRHASGYLCPMREGWRGAFSLLCVQHEKCFAYDLTLYLTTEVSLVYPI